ncbi:MAG: hypothetical protein U5J98_05595 [Halobacteriales archaeon]|nr:hypothetical protein [Halobacteriales archaeon]
MTLTRAAVEEAAAAYAESEPLYTVEAEEIEGLGPALASGEFGWRDAEWVVQWYYRRRLGEVPNRERREREAAYDENDYEAVRDALAAAAGADDDLEALDALTGLAGVDVGVASAFLLFLDPEQYLVVSDREWRALAAAGELDGPVPDPLTPEDYGAYLEAARAVADRLDCTLWTLYRALWRLGAEE